MPLFVIGPRIRSYDTGLFMLFIVSLIIVVNLIGAFCIQFSFLVGLPCPCPNPCIADFLQVLYKDADESLLLLCCPLLLMLFHLDPLLLLPRPHPLPCKERCLFWSDDFKDDDNALI
jgi:hypothetical protein